MNIEILGISNYEKLKGCKYYTSNFEMTDCPYVDKVKVEDTTDKKTDDNKQKKTNKSNGKQSSKLDFVFQLPSDTLIIVDEAHRCKNSNTINSKMLLAMKDSKCK